MAALAMKVQDGLDRAPSLASFRIPRNVTVSRDSPDKPSPPDMSGARSSLLDAIPDGDERSGDEAQASNSTNNVITQDTSIPADSDDMFDGMDDIFGTYLDPNYPINLDDWSMVDDLPPFDWNQVPEDDIISSARMTTGDSNQRVSAVPATIPQLATPLQAMAQEFDQVIRHCPNK